MSALGDDAPNVVGLHRRLRLDEGESIGGLLAEGEPTPALANVMYAVQQPLSVSALSDVMGPPAWKSLPSWYLVAQNDEATPPDAERLFAGRMGACISEIASSHVAMVSHPDVVADLIQAAAKELSPA